MTPPPVSTRSMWSEEMRHVLNLFIRPCRKVLQVFRLRHAVVIMAPCQNSLRPRVHLGVAFRCDVVGDAINDHVCDYFREVRQESEVMIVISCDIKNVLLVSSVIINPLHDLGHTIINIKHGTKQVVQVVGVGSPVNISLFVHQEKAIIVFSEKLECLLHMLTHDWNILEFFFWKVVANGRIWRDVESDIICIFVKNSFSAPTAEVTTIQSSVGHVTQVVSIFVPP
mmetsp:Transcript_40129/g.72309  ORF Transcript_40129/g.72309 Transcript_40129/m.72309 type:complete len:226 (-) Transcript_40129:72-749(-)